MLRFGNVSSSLNKRSIRPSRPFRILKRNYSGKDDENGTRMFVASLILSGFIAGGSMACCMNYIMN